MEPSIFQFSDFPSFLKAYVLARKRQQAWFSYRWLAKRLGFKSHTHLGAIVRGEKIATPKLVKELFSVFGLANDLLPFALALLSLQAAKTPTERRVAADAVERLRDSKKQPILNSGVEELLSTWYHVAVLELIGTTGFSEDPIWIANKLGPEVSPSAAAASLDLLERLGLIVRTKDGGLDRTQETYTSTHQIPSTSIRTFHKLMMERAAKAIDEVPVDFRLVLGHTLPIDPTKLADAFALIIEFRLKLHTLLQSTEGNEVYHLAIQLFPLVSPDSSNKGK